MGPTTPLAEHIHSLKHRLPGESFHDSTARIADAMSDGPEHFQAFKEILRGQRFLPGGRIQAAMGAPHATTPYNCFVSQTIHDSMDGIMRAAHQAATTMRAGGGIGYDFSTLRPAGDRIVGLGSNSSGPVSFMRIFDAVCSTIASAGHRRGAQMAVLRVDHPDIEAFVHCKQNQDQLTNFNISVGVTDDFMRAVNNDEPFPLQFEGRTYKRVNARALWNDIMRSTWDFAEPGVLFIDRINEMNNLSYCETIAATNPCGEQPLPPYGACLLGSFNLTKYVIPAVEGGYDAEFNWGQLVKDIPHVVRAMDNVVDRALYPFVDQKHDAVAKRRMGLGITGFANVSEVLGYPYGTGESLEFLAEVLAVVRDGCYMASTALSAEKGPFPLYTRSYLDSRFIATLPTPVQAHIAMHGIRNSHLLSIAPTGTISLTADNVSSGIEPPFAHEYQRAVRQADGTSDIHVVQDYALHTWGIKGVTADQCSADTHVDVLATASKYVDSAVSKTCNVGDDVTWDQFKRLYMDAWERGAKGCTTFRAAGQRKGILTVIDKEKPEGGACILDPVTGERSCED